MNIKGKKKCDQNNAIPYLAHLKETFIWLTIII